jgi:ubiquinone/menaquinone biosynthesis C-methylase UbiE
VAEWWEEAFRADYLRVYPHRDEDEAESDVASARAFVPGIRPGGRVLDLACGAGRHLRAMEAGGLRAVGADLSPDLLAEARRRGSGNLVRCDVRRLPFRGEVFTAVTLFFSSFGYFETPAEDAKVLREAARVLAPGGGLFLDLPWPTAVRRGLVPRSERCVDGVEIVEERSLAEEGKVVRKRVTLRRGGEVRSWTESLRLYARGEVLRMAADAGLRERPRARSRDDRRMYVVLEKAAA